MSGSRDIKFGKATLRIMPAGNVFKGTVIRDGERGEIFEDEDEGRLVARLRNDAGKLSPNYFGFEGAVRRFLSFFPAGFGDPAYIQKERTYKLEAQERLNDGCSLQAVLDGDFDKEAARRGYQTNMLSVFEAARVREVISGPNGVDFIRGAAELALGDLDKGLTAMTRAVTPYGRPSWPIVTYLPFLWMPEDHMFLKPEVTLDFSERVGHEFVHAYESDLVSGVYEKLLDLVQVTENAIGSLNPVDGIDVQSFIWVVGEYREPDAVS